MKWVDIDAHRDDADQRGIQSVPTFELPGRRVSGYLGKNWLWDQLTTNPSDSPATDSTTTPSQPNDVPSKADSSRTHSVEERPSSTPQPLPRLQRSLASTDATLLERESELSPKATPVPDLRAAKTSTGLRNADRADASERHIKQPSGRSSLWSRLRGAITRSAPLLLTAVEVVGLIGGTAATGGLSTLAVTALWSAWKRHRRRRRTRKQFDVTVTNDSPDREGTNRATARAPFPRRLDEASQLLALRQSEGRVAVLDALRGMFLDDELTKLTSSDNDVDAAVARKLQTAIDTRVDEVAPLSTTIDSDP